MANDLTQKATSGVSILKKYMSSDEVQNRLSELVGKRSPQMVTSVINLYNGNKKLQLCKPESIISAVFIAAALDLPVDPNLGFAAIVPYENRREGTATAQFQIMAKGLTQLAIRSGQYSKIHVTEVYSDELLGFNPIENSIEFVSDFNKTNMRDEADENAIVGYYAYFELIAGFKASLYMTKKQVTAHAKKFSKAYQYDLSKGYTTSVWSTDFSSMAKKTVLKLLLSKYGILSIEMQQAVEKDQLSEGDYIDNKLYVLPSEQSNDAIERMIDNAQNANFVGTNQQEEISQEDVF